MRSTTLVELAFVQLCSDVFFYLPIIFSNFFFVCVWVWVFIYLFICLLNENVLLSRRIIIIEIYRCTIFNKYYGNVIKNVWKAANSIYGHSCMCVMPLPPHTLSAHSSWSRDQVSYLFKPFSALSCLILLSCMTAQVWSSHLWKHLSSVFSVNSPERLRLHFKIIMSQHQIR